jgi:hypothetical protein
MYKIFIVELYENNHIKSWYGGKLAIESKEQEALYLFEVDEEVFKNAYNYKIVDNEIQPI